MSIDAGDRWVEAQINEREQVGRYMYEHQDDYISRSEYKKIVDKLTRAKELITKFVMASVYFNRKEVDLVKEAEQFLNEIAE